MKIEKISDNKIKVIVSEKDLENRNIDLNTLNYNSPAAQELFWDMMEQAEVQFGFDASDSQLSIEAVPNPDEGFTITITKLVEESDFESIQKYIKNKFRRADLKVKKKNRRICSTIMIYTFGDFEDLRLLCGKIQPMYSGDSSLYKCRNSYYLILTRNQCAPEYQRIFEAALNEFGRKISNTSFYEGYLSEYGERIIEYNAIETINNYF